LQHALQVVQQKVRQGVLLREGIKVVIAGQPNAGKSSLLNALAGAELAIVTPVAGTTRDKLQHTLQIEGVPVHVIDTAGLRESEDEVEKMGVERAWGAIKCADAVLFLHDLTRCNATDYIACDASIEKAITETIAPGVPIIILWSKADAMPDAAPQIGLTVSAKTGFGLSALRCKLLEMAGWQPPAEGVFIARERHVQALRRVEGHLVQADAHLADSVPTLDLMAEELRLAQHALSEITGEFTSDDLLGVIFSKFCIGK
jgi:tRNA modification GTPase